MMDFKVQQAKEIHAKFGAANIQEIYLINQEQKPMLPTMWNQFVTNERANISSIIATRPVIAGVRLRASAYTGLSLATNLKSTFFINPNIPEAIELQSWSMNNEDYPTRLTADTSNLTSSSRPTHSSFNRYDH